MPDPMPVPGKAGPDGGAAIPPVGGPPIGGPPMGGAPIPPIGGAPAIGGPPIGGPPCPPMAPALAAKGVLRTPAAKGLEAGPLPGPGGPAPG